MYSIQPYSGLPTLLASILLAGVDVGAFPLASLELLDRQSLHSSSHDHTVGSSGSSNSSGGGSGGGNQGGLLDQATWGYRWLRDDDARALDAGLIATNLATCAHSLTSGEGGCFGLDSNGLGNYCAANTTATTSVAANGDTGVTTSITTDGLTSGKGRGFRFQSNGLNNNRTSITTARMTASAGTRATTLVTCGDGFTSSEGWCFRLDGSIQNDCNRTAV